jgi:hypothetical protein
MKKILFALMFLCSSSWAALTDIKFGRNQIADSQWNVSACLNTTTCQIYSKQPGTMYRIPWTNGMWSWQTGQYVQFSLTGNGSFPYEGKVYNSNGTLAGTIGTGKIVNMGPDYFFFVGSDNNTGQLFSGSSGMNNTSGVSWTGTRNPTISQADAYANATYSTVPLSAGQTATSTPNNSNTPAPDWKLIRTNSTPVVISTIFPTSNNSPFGEGATQAFDGNVNTKYLNFDKKNAGVTVKLSQGRVVQKFTLTTANDFSGRDPTSYKLYGSNDGVNWILIKQDSLSLSEQRFWTSPEIAVANTTAYVYYFILFPTTKAGEGCGLNCDSMQIAEVTYYYDLNDGVTSTDTGSGGTPANPGQAGSVCADCAPTWPSTSDITVGQTAQKNSAKSRVSNVALGNSLHLEQKIGSSGNAVTIEQTGNYNKISGLGGGTYAVIDGDNNTVNIRQGDTLGKNLIEFNIVGNTNNVSIWQARNPTTGLQDGSESGGHYMGLNINGSTNTLSLRQSNNGGSSSGHFAYVDVTGNNNNGTLRQTGNGEKTFFGIIAGNTNIFDVTQQGNGSYLDLSLTGNGHNVTANQKDAGSHKATINLTNAGGASTVNLVQQGATAQNINITQQCATLSGCSVSVTQGTGP